LPPGHARRLGHNDFTIAVQAVQRPYPGNKHRHRRQQRHDLRCTERNNVEIGQGALAILDDNIRAREALCEDGKQRQTPNNDEHGPQDTVEDILLDVVHS